MDSKKLIRKLWKKFPIKIAKKYHDYVGLMVSHLRDDTSKIIVCLDVSPLIVEEAINSNVDLIISHHPFIYGKKKYVLLDPLKKEMYDKLEEHNIPVYSFHTNFDEGKGGMNDALAKALHLTNIRPIPNLEMARMGEIEPQEIHEFSKTALKALNVSYGQLIAKGNTQIKTIGILGGAGSREYNIALENGCDLFISGDTPYHIRKEVHDKKLNYLHLDHEIERIFIPTMAEILKEIDSNLEVIQLDDIEQAELIKID